VNFNHTVVFDGTAYEDCASELAIVTNVPDEVIDEILARRIVEQLPLTTVNDLLTRWNQPIVPLGIPNQPIINGSESDDDSLPEDAPDMNVEVYVNNINGDSGLIDDANVGDSVYDDIAVNNDVPVAPVVANEAMETTKVDDAVDDETLQVDDDSIPVTENIEQDNMPVFGYCNLQSNLKTNGRFMTTMAKVHLD
jgi:hypothetical protein